MTDKAIAQRGEQILYQVEETDKGYIADKGKKGPEMPIQSILARGYWEPYTGVHPLVAAHNSKSEGSKAERDENKGDMTITQIRDNEGIHIHIGTATSGRYPKGSGLHPRGYDKAARVRYKTATRDERREIAAGEKAIPQRQEELLKSLGDWEDTGTLAGDVTLRINTAVEQGNVPRGSGDMLNQFMNGDPEDPDNPGYISTLRASGIDEETAAELSQMATDALLAQEMEAQNRQLGDHGIHHILGDIDRANEFMDINPDLEPSAIDKAAMMTALIYHDTGYMTDPSRNLQDDVHGLSSADHFAENVQPLYEEAYPGMGETVYGLIENHDGADLDWQNDPLGSAVRLADNTALFADDKLPPIFRDIPGNIEQLPILAIPNLSPELVDTIKMQMRENVANTPCSDEAKERYNKAIDEVFGKTGKFTAGMLGGNIDSISWEGDHPVLNLKESDIHKALNTIGDHGQAQFAKLYKTYGGDPADLEASLNFKVTDDETGQTVLEARTRAALAHLLKQLKGDKNVIFDSGSSIQNEVGIFQNIGTATSGRYPKGSGLHPRPVSTSKKEFVPTGDEEHRLIWEKTKARVEAKRKQEEEELYRKVREENAERLKPISQKAREEIHRFELEHEADETETILVVTKDGQPIFTKSGDTNHIAFTEEEEGMFKNCIVSHNHPTDHSFSPPDWRFAADADPAEFRAAGSKGSLYIMERPEAGWPPADKVQAFVAQEDYALRDEFWGKINAGQMTPEEAEEQHYHVVAMRVAARLGITYRRGRTDD